MKELAVFAGYFKDGSLPFDTLLYISEIARSHDVIAVFDNEISECDQSKLDSICIKVISGKHGLYDFGSYKIGVEYAFSCLNMDDYNSMLIANDSVLLIEKNLNNVLGEFDPLGNVDFWGVYVNTMEKYYKNESKAHIQSYFVRFGYRLIRSKVFTDFFSSINKQDSKSDIIDKYEIGMTSFFKSNGFSYSSLITRNRNDTVSYKAVTLWSEGFPFFKKSAFKESVFVRFFGYYILRKDCSEDIKRSVWEYKESVKRLDVINTFRNKLLNKIRSKI